MPLYMDFHKFEHVTIEDVKSAHIADQAIQDKYGVKYHQFWVNEAAGTVFCLTEGPDKASCELVHKLAHGNMACSLVEVEPGFYKMMMGGEHNLDHGLVKQKDGSIDLGYRTILFIRGSIVRHEETDFTNESDARHVAYSKISFYHGTSVKLDNATINSDDAIIGVFTNPSEAVQCAIALQQHFSTHRTPAISFQMGIVTDQPVTIDGDFFSQAITQANRLSITARDKQIIITNLTKRLCHDGTDFPAEMVVCVDESDVLLVTKFLDATEAHLSDEGFTIDDLCREVGLSRPQLYRKITTLTGRAPNDFVRDIRLEKGWTLLKRKKGNIAQVALEVGYNNPSYFTKCFTERYGITPSKFLHNKNL
jgi:AraC-like DNA-binding protein